MRIVAPSRPTSIVVVSIAAIADQAGLDPVNLVGTVEVDGEEVVPTAVAWRVGGATSGISDATDLTTTYTPTEAGKHVVSLSAEVDGAWHHAEVEPFTVGSGALTASLAAISNQLTLAAIQGAATASGGVGTKAHAHTVNGATTGLADPTVEDPTFTPTAAGTYTWVYTVTDQAGQTATATRTFTVGDADGFLTDLDIDFRQAVTLTADGAYTIDGVSVTMANLSAAATKECSVANGLYLVHDGTGTPDPQAQINLKTLLANAGHTFDPAAYEYRISWQWVADPSNVGFGTVVSLNDGGVGAAGERFFVGSARTNNMMTGGEGTWKDDWAITPQSSMSILVHGHDFDVRYGTKSVDTWDGNTSGMTRFGDTQRSFNARAHLVTTATVTTWDTSALTLIFKVTEATGTGKLYRLWVAHRSRQ